MINHDPSEYIRGLQQILISDKKRIGFLFGAGTSLSSKNDKSLTIPAIGKMTKEIVAEIGNEDSKLKIALEEIKNELGKDNFNIETILSNLEQKRSIIGNGILNNLQHEDFKCLIDRIKCEVRKKVSVHIDKDKIVGREVLEEMVQSDFANWIGQAERKYPIEIFTTNYDFLFELGLEYKEIPYYDGFCGSLRSFFNPESVEDLMFLPNQTKLWKIHGSLGWHHERDLDKIVRVSPSDNDILIYPSTLKYKDSKKQPYESLLDRLSNFLKQDDSILITCGYSWGDEHINSRIISALKRNTTSHVIALVFDKRVKDEEVYFELEKDIRLLDIGRDNPKISIYGGEKAVIGRKLGTWKLKSKPSKEDAIELYFKEELSSCSNNTTEDATWFGLGEFILADFSRLTTFLNSMVSENEIRKHGQDVKK